MLKNSTNIYIYEIAEKYNLSAEAVSDINLGKRYYNPELSYPLRGDTKFKPGMSAPKGIYSHKAKFDKEKLEQVYNLLQTSNLSFVEIAKKFNVSDTTISKINRGITYYQEGFNYPVR